MPIVKVNGININYQVEGQGTLVLIKGYGVGFEKWLPVLPGLSKKIQGSYLR